MTYSRTHTPFWSSNIGRITHWLRWCSQPYFNKQREKSPRKKPRQSHNIKHIYNIYNIYICILTTSNHICLVVLTILKNMKVKWEHYSQYMENNPAMFQTTNQTYHKHLPIISPSPSPPCWDPRGTAHCREHGDAAVLDLHRSEVLEVVPPLTATHKKLTRFGEMVNKGGRSQFGMADFFLWLVRSPFNRHEIAISLVISWWHGDCWGDLMVI